MPERYRMHVDPNGDNNPHSFALQLIGSGHRILEVGCGLGLASLVLVVPSVCATRGVTAPLDAGAESAEDAAARQEIAEAFIRQWKINRLLFEQYGGRVVYQQGGPEPLDAYRAFLEEQQRAGTFSISDGTLQAEFWRYYVDDARHSFYPPGREGEAFATAPWEADRADAG